MIILIPEKKEIHQSAIELLIKHGVKIVYSYDKKNLIDIEGLFIRTYTQAHKKYINQFSNLKYILRAGVGLDNIDLEECNKRNIKVINAPGSNSNSVAEYVIAVMIMLSRNFLKQNNLLYKHEWRERKYMGGELTNKVIGLVGCGAIGRIVASKLESFDIREIIGYDPYLNKEFLAKFNIKKLSLDEIIRNSDIISLHLPLTKETNNLFDDKKISLMKKNAYIINTSRGGIIKEKSLIRALKKNRIGGAALDVFESEPNINAQLLNCDNLILTPHIAGFTKEADKNMSLAPVLKFIEMIK